MRVCLNQTSQYPRAHIGKPVTALNSSAMPTLVRMLRTACPQPRGTKMTSPARCVQALVPLPRAGAAASHSLMGSAE